MKTRVPAAAATDPGRRRALARVVALVLAPAVSGIVRAERPAGEIRLRELYEKDGSFSVLAQERAGERVDVSGFMAPPLKADAAFFVLTKRPMTVCPFCSDEAEWPRDILAVYTVRTVRTIAFNIPLVASGRLELGTHTDPDTGFVSRVRLVDASVARA